MILSIDCNFSLTDFTSEHRKRHIRCTDWTSGTKVTRFLLLFLLTFFFAPKEMKKNRGEEARGKSEHEDEKRKKLSDVKFAFAGDYTLLKNVHTNARAK